MNPEHECEGSIGCLLLAHAEKGGGRLSSLVPKKFGESVMR